MLSDTEPESDQMYSGIYGVTAIRFLPQSQIISSFTYI